MTHGKLTLDGREWRITTTPDVTMRLKRIFPRLAAETATELRLTRSPEVDNDLEWVLIRFPMEMSESDASMLRAGAAGHRAKLERLASIFDVSRPPAEFKLACPLRDYQTLSATLFLESGRLLLGDEVGLGKTATAIASFTDKRTLPALVVVKAHLPKQWEAEIKKFIPDAWVHIVKQVKEYKLPAADIFIISYSKLYAWWGYFAGKVKCVVYDEIQELRVTTSNKYDAAQKLNELTPFKIGLSATPIYNYGGETWNVFNLLAPDELGSAQEFHQEWCTQTYGGKWAVKDPDALGHHLRKQNLLLRRTRKEVGRVLPPVVRYVQDVEFDRQVYENRMSAADELARVILSGSFTERGEAARKFDLEIRQTTGIAKAPYVAELVRMLVDSGEQVLLAGWHRAVYAIWADRLRDLNPVFFTGSESPKQKEDARQAFISGKSKVLIMSLRSGDGTNGLQDVCSCCVLGEMDWSPAVHTQFIGRLARDGQKASVQVFIPVAPIGSDPTMASVLGYKSSQAEGIIDLGTAASPDFVETDPQRLKQLAIDYLKSRRLPIPVHAA